MRPLSCFQVPATAPSIVKVGNDCGVFVPKILGRCSSGRKPVRRAWTSRLASQVPRKRGGAGVSGSGRGAPGTSSRSSSRSRSSRASDGGRRSRGGRPVNDDDVLGGRRAEAGEVAGDEVVDRVLVAERGRRADPVLGERVEVGPAALPRARRRRAHEVDPQPDHPRGLLAHELLDLLAPHGVAAGQRRPHPLRRLDRRVDLRGAQPRRAARLPHRDRERPEVLPRDQVDRAAHQRRLDDAAVLERAREVVAHEALDARPQADVHRRRVLRLQPRHPLEHPGDRVGRPLQQPLAGQESPVERPR